MSRVWLTLVEVLLFVIVLPIRVAQNAAYLQQPMLFLNVGRLRTHRLGEVIRS